MDEEKPTFKKKETLRLVKQRSVKTSEVSRKESNNSYQYKTANSIRQ